MSEPIIPTISDTRPSDSKQQEEERLALITRKAKEIADAGETFTYILKVWQKRHNGDTPIGKALLLSLGSQSILNSKGIHVLATGDGGYGKSDAIKQMGKLVYPYYWKNGGITPNSLYYSGDEMPDGVVVGLEDIVWTSDIGTAVKRITSDFQEGATKLTTVDMKGKEVRSAKRIAFWGSCVDSQADEQLRDRFAMVSIESDPNRGQKIIGCMKEQDEGKQFPKDYDFETMVCQFLTFDLKQKLYHVVIPFANKIKFEGDPRAYGIFSDMIKSSAVLSYRKREKDDVGRLIATSEDFENAKKLFIELGGHDRDKYTDSEIRVLNAIIENKRSATQDDIQKTAKLSAGRVSDILNGRGKGGQGLTYKCKYLTVCCSSRQKIYELPSDFSLNCDISIKLEETVPST